MEIYRATRLEGETLFAGLATIAFNTSAGLFVCGIASDGVIDQHDDVVFFEGSRITSSNIIRGDEVIVTYDATVPVEESEESGSGFEKQSRIARIRDASNPNSDDDVFG